MAERSTGWRQGNILLPTHIIPEDVSIDCDTQRVVLISHDCDLAQPSEKEPYVEFIIANLSAKENGSYYFAQNPRLLQFKIDLGNGCYNILQLQHTDKYRVDKASFLQNASKDNTMSLAPNQKIILAKWLAFRYNRAAFPDAFNNRLDRVQSKLKEILARADKYIIIVFFDMHDFIDIEKSAGDPYPLTISLVYDSKINTASEQSAEITRKIEELFENSYGKKKIADEIALQECTAYPDTKFPFSNVRKMYEWRLEHISLKSGSANSQ
jgi:hypothetical protein